MSYFDISWDNFFIQDKLTSELINARFKGPGIAQAYKLQESDRIRLDLTKQYSKVLPSFFIIELEWVGIHYKKEDTISLRRVYIKDIPISISKDIRDTDFMRVYLVGHDDTNHRRHLVYITEVRNEYGELKHSVL
jgi:hypothetical protein